MFFQLSKKPAENFPCHSRIGNLWLSHDHGWHYDKDVWCKGYIENHCKFVANNQSIQLKHDHWRSFPLWYDDTEHVVTNLSPCGRQIWADENIEIFDNGIESSRRDLHVFWPDNPTNVTVDSIADSIVRRFENDLQQFRPLPKSVFVSGGLDTLVCAALSRPFDDIALIDFPHWERDFFIDNNLQRIQSQFWAYKQLHHWCDPHVLITGGCGDEYLMRGPSTVAAWAAWHDFDMIAYAETHAHCYMSRYYLLDKNRQIFQQIWQKRQYLKHQLPSYSDLVRYLLNILVNDHQHWHLGNTLTFTPMRNVELAWQILHLPYDVIVQQMTEGIINRFLIRHRWPELEQLLSASKNHDTGINMQRFEQVRLTRKERPRIL